MYHRNTIVNFNDNFLDLVLNNNPVLFKFRWNYSLKHFCFNEFNSE